MSQETAALQQARVRQYYKAVRVPVVNELVEAQQHNRVKRVLTRWRNTS